MPSDFQCPKQVEGRRCIYSLSHGGECFSPDDSLDHSDEIRIRILRDRIAEIEKRLGAQNPA